MIVNCYYCKEDVDVALYFHQHIITSTTFHNYGTIEYKASAVGKAICPCCGYEISKSFSSIISNKDIVKLATGKELIK